MFIVAYSLDVPVAGMQLFCSNLEIVPNMRFSRESDLDRQHGGDEWGKSNREPGDSNEEIFEKRGK